MNKKGFSLIELLAVLVILSIVGIITVPYINNIIIQSQENSDLESARNYIIAAEQYQSRAIGNAEMKEKMYTNIFPELTITGKKAESGTIKFDEDGNLYVSIIINNKCYLKTETEKDITLHDDIRDCTS